MEEGDRDEEYRRKGKAKMEFVDCKAESCDCELDSDVVLEIQRLRLTTPLVQLLPPPRPEIRGVRRYTPPPTKPPPPPPRPRPPPPPPLQFPPYYEVGGVRRYPPPPTNRNSNFPDYIGPSTAPPILRFSPHYYNDPPSEFMVERMRSLARAGPPIQVPPRRNNSTLRIGGNQEEPFFVRPKMTKLPFQVIKEEARKKRTKRKLILKIDTTASTLKVEEHDEDDGGEPKRPKTDDQDKDGASNS